MKRMHPAKKKVSAARARPQPQIQNTSWGKVAEWYDGYLEENLDSYHKQVIEPNLLRILQLDAKNEVLDIACGQGFFTRAFSGTGAQVDGCDISSELIAKAKSRGGVRKLFVAPAHQLGFARDGAYDTATIVLAAQNIANIGEAFQEAARVLSAHGRLVMVLNHPAFRIPKKSSWHFDPSSSTQFRRIDSYLSAFTAPIIMHPGQSQSATTVSYHRPLQDFFKALFKAGFAVTRLEEWISHKKSEAGPKQKAEDTARKEVPLFLMLEATKL